MIAAEELYQGTSVSYFTKMNGKIETTNIKVHKVFFHTHHLSMCVVFDEENNDL